MEAHHGCTLIEIARARRGDLSIRANIQPNDIALPQKAVAVSLLLRRTLRLQRSHVAIRAHAPWQVNHQTSRCHRLEDCCSTWKRRAESPLGSQRRCSK